MSTPHVERALLLIEQHRHEPAEEQLRQALIHEPEDPTAHALLALCLTERKQFAEATREAELAIHLAPDFPYAHFVHARLLSERNRDAEALTAAREAVRLDPADADYAALEAGILYDQRQWAEALAAADRGLQLNAEHVGCANLRAMALVKLNRRSEAGAAIQGTLARNPENALTHANQGWALLEDGQTEPALHHFQEALRLDPQNDWARQGIVEALKARHSLYAVCLKYFLFMSKLSPRAQWGVVLGGYFLNRFLAATAQNVPALAPWLLPVRVVYVAFIILTWAGDPLFNLLLRFNRLGRLALSRDQTMASNWIGGCIGLALLAVGAAILTNLSSLSLLALVCGGLIIPLAGTFNSHAGWPRRTMAIYTGVLAAAGLAAVGVVLAGAAESDAGTSLLAIVVIGMIAAPWVANVLMTRRPKL